MVYRLTPQEECMLRYYQPELHYLPKANIIVGKFRLHAKFRDKETITDNFDVLINLDSGKELLPKVIEMKGKIKRMAQLHKSDLADFHQYNDGALCLARPDKIKEWYKDGFSFEKFMQHLETHFYWVCYKDRYDKEPWQAEKHGW